MKRLLLDENGATAVEYAMIIGLIALISFVVYQMLGGEVKRIIMWMYVKLHRIQG